MLADFHCHTSFSGDSDARMENHIEKALAENLSILCFTDHYDADYPYTDVDFDISPLTPSYYDAYKEMQSRFGHMLDLRFGIELGLQPHLTALYKSYIEKYPFDFVIGSTHLVHGQDPYYRSFWEDRPVKEALTESFEANYENVKAADYFDACGHLDYVVRYIPDPSYTYKASDFIDYIDETLRILIDRGQALEVNTSGYKAGLGAPNPCRDILIRYKELGGELLTLGSDAHFSEYIGYRFDLAAQLIRDCGFKYLAAYRQRKRHMLDL